MFVRRNSSPTKHLLGQHKWKFYRMYEKSPHIWIIYLSVALYLHFCDLGWPYVMLTTYLLTYLLHGAESLLKSKLVSAASQEIPRIFGTRRFLTVPKSARQLSLSWANSIQSPQLPSTSWRSILILFCHLRLGLPNGLFPSGFPIRTLSTLLDVDNTVWKCTWVKAVTSQHLAWHFLIVVCCTNVRMADTSCF